MKGKPAKDSRPDVIEVELPYGWVAFDVHRQPADPPDFSYTRIGNSRDFIWLRGSLSKWGKPVFDFFKYTHQACNRIMVRRGIPIQAGVENHEPIYESAIIGRRKVSKSLWEVELSWWPVTPGERGRARRHEGDR